MDQVSFASSDFIFYALELGTITEQIEFLDTLNISEPRLVVDSSFNEVLLFTSTIVNKHLFYSRFCMLHPSKISSIRNFNGIEVLDIRRYLFDRGFNEKFHLIMFKNETT